jgi:fluoride exporter
MSQVHPLTRIETVLMIGIGGFAGSNLRYFVELTVPSTLGATLAVNAIGSFTLGVLLYEGIYSGRFSDQAGTVFGTGFLSSFTTYSMFAFDLFTSAPPLALAYLGASYLLGFLGVLAGQAVARGLEEI